jgi:hypothetical protein
VVLGIIERFRLVFGDLGKSLEGRSLLFNADFYSQDTRVVIAYLLMDRMPNIVTLKASFVKRSGPSL